MDYHFTLPGDRSKLDIMSEGFIEAMLETLIALATAAAVCVSVISLSAHLNEARTAPAAVAGATPPTAEGPLPSGVAGVGASEQTSNFN